MFIAQEYKFESEKIVDILDYIFAMIVLTNTI